MNFPPRLAPLSVVVGSGGVGKTTVAASLAMMCAERGERCLVMTFDPSLRLKDALGMEGAEAGAVVAVEGFHGLLSASLLDARVTFDRLVQRYSSDEAARQRILENRYYHHLAGSLAGILEYMAVERLYEVRESGQFDRIILDTPPAKQALDFLEAPQRIVSFLDSGALKIALKPWFSENGRLRAASRMGPLGNRIERFLDEVVGIDLLRDMSEFFQAFGPLFDGFRLRALEVEQLLASHETGFLLVAGPGGERNPDTLFFARKLMEANYTLDSVIVNRLHPEVPGVPTAPTSDGLSLLRWLGERDREGVDALRRLLGAETPLLELPQQPFEPSDAHAMREILAALAGFFGR